MRVLILILFLLVNTPPAFSTMSVDKFFTAPQLLTATVSPNGDLLAILELVDDKQVIYLQDTNTQKKVKWISIDEITEEEAAISRLVWLDNQHLAANLFEIKEGVKDLIDTKGEQSLLILKTPNKGNVKIYSVRSKGELVDSLPNTPNEFLYAKTGIQSKVYQLKINKLLEHGKRANKLTRVDGGQFVKSNEHTSIDGYVVEWFLELDKSIRYAALYNRDGTLDLVDVNNKEETKKLKSWNLKDLENAEQFIVPVARSAEPGSFYALDKAEENTRSVYLVNYDSNKQELIYQSDSFDIKQVITDPATNNLIGLRTIRNGLMHFEFIDSKNEELSKLKIESAISQDLSRINTLVYSESYNQVGQFDFYKGKKKQFTVGHRYPKYLNQSKAKLELGEIEVAGLNIPYLLTYPSSPKKKMPLVLLPHGGPIGVHDNPYFDHTSRFLNQLGYAVLRVNYRGSSGYTKEFEEAGALQWGDQILNDLHTVTEFIVKRPDIDSKRVCVVGMSYGGYAAMMLPIKHSEFYKCAVSIAGVSDVALQATSPYMTDRQFKWTKKYIGDVDNDYLALKAISPVYHFDKLKTPLLLIHGEEDHVVDVEHAYRSKLMLDKHNKRYDFTLVPEAGHSFSKLEQRHLMFNQTQKFLAKYL
ncbi:alpha/beta hydrolase family protein [Pleionea litopenaei]|uniref:Prolyl oligopeptidase family serine peptidase n=1 Tax=Pleionea litopenaei TaxID=3070815 RepID=A0AA51X5T9_9GAMM|nr:alpha/beta fold hydrolase [Pleionea sp. HL-JVS1]WMS86066.1 prolyl oligopeptidase family serine peptidase [Pleionea sp. HL-JVS1]